MYYHVYPVCGANLDPGEICDCREEKKVPPSELQLRDGEYTNQAYMYSAIVAQNRRFCND